MKLVRWIRNFLAALAFGVPSFERGKDSASEQVLKAPLEEKTHKDQIRAGTTQRIQREYGVTIAGGPGSQNIGKAFDALPPDVKAQMLAARKGRIIRGDALAETPEGGSVLSSHDKLSRGISAAMARDYTRKPTGELTTKQKPGWVDGPKGTDGRSGESLKGFTEADREAIRNAGLKP
ncbi:MAG: hypothetical protein KGN77_17045 [Xanthomonadaceae bacterium]|nr:hypothetical protein [Xanthomonadaceae bacterium]